MIKGNIEIYVTDNVFEECNVPKKDFLHKLNLSQIYFWYVFYVLNFLIY